MTDERNISLTEEEIRELIANEFPRLITQNPEIRYELIGVMSETFAKKEDITTILNELKQMREESERQRGEFRQEMRVLREESNRLREESEQQWGEFRQEMQVLREESNRLREESEQRWGEFRQQMEVQREESNRLREESEQRWGEFRQEMQVLREESNRLREESRALRAYLDDSLRRFNHTVQGLGARWGLLSEEAFRNGLAAILTDDLGFRVERYEGYDDSGSVFGQPEQVEIDVIIRNALVIAIEIKSSVSRSDLSLFQRKIAFFEQTENVTVNRRFFISPFVDPNAVDLGGRDGHRTLQPQLRYYNIDIVLSIDAAFAAAGFGSNNYH